MNESRRREFAAAVIIDTHGRLLLQQREDIPGIRAPGKIGLFGGHREGSETFLECVARELREELSYAIPAEHFEPMGSYMGADSLIQGGKVFGELYIVRGIPVEAINVTEGALFVADPKDISSLMDRLAPPAATALRLLFSNM